MKLFILDIEIVKLFQDPDFETILRKL